MKYECAVRLDHPVHAPDRMAVMGMQWFMFRKGPAAGNNLETMALLKSDPSLPQPDIEIQHLAIVFDHDKGIDAAAHGFTYCIGPNRVEGRGWVKLRSANPEDPPRILTNFLSTDRDWQGDAGGGPHRPRGGVPEMLRPLPQARARSGSGRPDHSGDQRLPAPGDRERFPSGGHVPHGAKTGWPWSTRR